MAMFETLNRVYGFFFSKEKRNPADEEKIPDPLSSLPFLWRTAEKPLQASQNNKR